MRVRRKQNGMNANENAESTTDLLVCQLNKLLVGLILTGWHHDHTVHVWSMDKEWIPSRACAHVRIESVIMHPLSCEGGR